ncbi:hypothetical protein [Bacillus sp. AFS053548]|uniref:hypothetical protein n=1 Tax=Bacillus sp. AFS053548 TaxID=2033505 RepID=UPI000BFD5FB8|nr:hypothetical protein [Bacillus sp. AFS053548]PGM53274.1 hypothetical protein CN946_17135 [Bacillus sp. AFS053548]
MTKIGLLKEFIINKNLEIIISKPTNTYTKYSYNGFDAGEVYNNDSYRISIDRGSMVERIFRKRKYKMKISKDNNTKLIAIFDLEHAEDFIQVKTILLNMAKLVNNGLRESMKPIIN